MLKPSLVDHVVHLENGQLADDTPRAAIDAIAQKAVAHGGGIAVHFHGGLVNYKSGLKVAERLAPHYRAEGGAYPVFFAWESGLIETIVNNSPKIQKEKIFRWLWKRVAGIAKRKFAQSAGQRAANALPPIDTSDLDVAIEKALDEARSEPLGATEAVPDDGLAELSQGERLALEQELAIDPVLIIETQKISNALRDPAEIEAESRTRSATVAGSTETLMDPEALDQLVDRPDPGARGILTTIKMASGVVRVAARVISRYVRKRHHGFHATVVEEILRAFYVGNIGGRIWKMMKDDTADAFGDDGQTFGGTAFLEALRDAIGDGEPPAITLIGHSTGAIYISEFIAHAAQILPAARFGVVFLAPASTFEKTASTLEQHRDKIRELRMFTMTDENERNDRLVPVLYPHSLLYFVSGVAEPKADTPLVGMQRFFDPERFSDEKFPAIKTVRDFMIDRAVWSVADQASPGRLSASLKHVDFDNDETTLASVAHILAEGFDT